jgi:TRAP-type mannitol/chloroaromatic compound transport system substrate-binding protein
MRALPPRAANGYPIGKAARSGRETLEEHDMQRRNFLKTAGAGIAASAAVAAPAIAQSAPEIRWRLTSSFPRSLDTIFGTCELFAKALAEATDGKFKINVHAPNEIVGGLQAMDAVSNGTVEIAHTCSYYYVGKDPAFALGTAVPFGPNSRQMNAWLYAGGGNQLLNEFYAPLNFVAFPCGNTGAQMGGWFRKEINTVADLQGLKMRIAGLAGQVMAKLGVVPQQLAGPEVYPALERGVLDAAEWVGPYDDLKLGFAKVAKYYYYPGWWEFGPTLHLYVNKTKFEELPASYKKALELAADMANTLMLAKYDAENPKALRELVAQGAVLKPYSREILEAGYKAWQEVAADISAKNPAFKKLYDSQTSFRNEETLWFRVAELPLDAFMAQMQSRG